MQHGKRVVVVGSDGPVPEAVQAAIRERGWTITAVRRGDDSLESVAGADAVVVLEAVSGDPALYQTALRAVAESLRDAPVARVVALTPHRMPARQRKSAAERFHAADEEARGAGVPLVVVRYGLLVGTRRHRSPTDAALFGRRIPILPIPGRGGQRVRPLLVDDLARIVAVAIESAEPGETIEAEGPETFGLRGLVAALAGPRRLILPFRRWATGVVALVGLGVPYAILMTSDPVEPSVTAPAIAAVVYLVGLVAGVRLFGAQRLLPDADLLLLGSEPRTVAGVSLKRVGDEWGSDPAKERALRRELRRSLRRYRLQAASPLISAFLVALGIAGAVVGTHDVLFGEALGIRLAGLLVALAGIVTAAGGASLLIVGWAGRYVAAFIGGLVGSAMLIALLVSAGVSRDPSAMTGGVAYLLLVCIACCIALARRGWTVVSRFVADNAGKTLSTVAAGGAIVVLVQFLYTGVYLPTAGTPSVNMSATLTPAGRVGKRMALDATITVKNSTKNTVNVLDSYYVVLTAGVAATNTRVLSPAEEAAAEGALRAEQPVRSFATVSRPRVAERGTLTASGWFLEPGEEVRRHLVVLVPRRAALATVRASIALARRRFVVTIPNWPDIQQVGGRHVVIQGAQIDDPSWIHKITRSDRYIHAVSPYGTAPMEDCDPGALLVTWIDGDKATNAETPCTAGESELSERFSEHYGLTWSETSAQIAVSARKPGGGGG